MSWSFCSKLRVEIVDMLVMHDSARGGEIWGNGGHCCMHLPDLASILAYQSTVASFRWCSKHPCVWGRKGFLNSLLGSMNDSHWWHKIVAKNLTIQDVRAMDQSCLVVWGCLQQLAYPPTSLTLFLLQRHCRLIYYLTSVEKIMKCYHRAGNFIKT